MTDPVHEAGTERSPTPEMVDELDSYRTSIQSTMTNIISDFLTGDESEMALRMQALMEALAFNFGHLESVAALGGASQQFRTELVCDWMAQGRRVALDQHRTVCSGCKEEQVLVAQLSPS
jgi:hypothetical protein